MATGKVVPISELTLEQIVAIIVLLEMLTEPSHGFTLSELHKEISTDHPGTKYDLLKKLKVLRERNQACFKKRKYWGTPKTNSLVVIPCEMTIVSVW
jgi:hypothetical protein